MAAGYVFGQLTPIVSVPVGSLNVTSGPHDLPKSRKKGSISSNVRGQNIPRNKDNRGAQVSSKLINRGQEKGNEKTGKKNSRRRVLSLKYGKIGVNLRKCPYNLINKGIPKYDFVLVLTLKRGLNFTKCPWNWPQKGVICICGNGHTCHSLQGSDPTGSFCIERPSGCNDISCTHHLSFFIGLVI